MIRIFDVLTFSIILHIAYCFPFFGRVVLPWTDNGKIVIYHRGPGMADFYFKPQRLFSEFMESVNAKVSTTCIQITRHPFDVEVIQHKIDWL